MASGVHSSGEIYVYLGGTDWFTSGANITANNWHHIAIVRAVTGGDVYVYINGVKKAQRQVNNSIDNQGALGFGSWFGSGQFYGYIDEFRFRKEAVYTGNFTPPTALFTY